MYIMSTLPSIGGYTYTPTSKSVIISSDGYKLGEITSRDATYISADEIPDKLKYAVVALEDKRFYKHFGVDPIGIARAFYNNFKAGEIIEGGSTITQQVAKNLFFSTKKSYIRKIKEALTAVKMEIEMEKDEILCIYLNEIYFGAGAYGVYEASMAYFNREPMDLTLSECAMLAGIIQAPSAYCPLYDEGYEYAMQRKDKVLDIMAQEGYISEEERDKAKSQKIKITPDNDSTFAYGVCEWGCESYLNRVYEQCIRTISDHYEDKMNYSEEDALNEAERLIMNENLTINVTMNYEMQKNALSSMKNELEGKDRDADCAFVAVDINNGNILAYFGSDSNIDMANAPRQPGSTIKPLYMAYLIDKGVADRNTIVDDTRFDINGYSPGNFAGEYYGYVTMRETLVNSLNAASLRFFLMADTGKMVNYIEKLGISTIDDGDYNAAFALGGMVNGIKPREMASAYAVIANGGTLYEEVFVESIVSDSGVIIYPEKTDSKKVMSSETSSQIKSCLESVVLRGTGMKADPGYSTMGKTGTTDNEKDVWFAGSTGNVSMAVWIGNVDYLNVNNLASSWCSRIYKNTITSSIKDGSLKAKYLVEKRSEETTSITLLNEDIPSKGFDVNELDEDSFISITVPDYEVSNFADRQVVKVMVDSITGDLFVEGKCNPSFMKEKYYLLEDAPTKECDMIHMSDVQNTVEGWFDSLFE
ncbi:MAG: transglycosylase domain-containing protein [Eubacteriaceae bacterium]|nr:transglycosylase domain-containing protein [Eubacteriaceae bacterium]